ncbi:uncharacterized protein A4U43_C09F15060 [Asparagus officinalis]|uniref:Uncharacterized protein n=1 Tax=Asparagus officinalis TaxID=4686 RepID=A0A5P1E9K1_ASPOF|nr:uncharacterized protein A4U43_C09F15060 [Asparagus officinalis]
MSEEAGAATGGGGSPTRGVVSAFKGQGSITPSPPLPSGSPGQALLVHFFSRYLHRPFQISSASPPTPCRRQTARDPPAAVPFGGGGPAPAFEFFCRRVGRTTTPVRDDDPLPCPRPASGGRLPGRLTDRRPSPGRPRAAPVPASLSNPFRCRVGLDVAGGSEPPLPPRLLGSSVRRVLDVLTASCTPWPEFHRLTTPAYRVEAPARDCRS